MIRFLLHAAIVVLGLWIAQAVVPGVAFDSPKVLIEAGLLLAVVNALLRPLLVLLTLPLTILTLGLWLLVLNALMIGLVAYFLHGFHLHGFVAAFLCWVVVSLTSWVAGWFIARG